MKKSCNTVTGGKVKQSGDGRMLRVLQEEKEKRKELQLEMRMEKREENVINMTGKEK